jgi:tricorn protease-like protein
MWYVVVDLQGNPTCIGKESFETVDISSAALGPPQAKWSPDGKKIAYMYMMGKGEQLETIGSDIYVENPDGTGRIQVTNTPDEFEVYPVWSPDGTKIACTGYNSHKIYVIRIK